jgi:hypothetical protein
MANVKRYGGHVTVEEPETPTIKVNTVRPVSDKSILDAYAPQPEAATAEAASQPESNQSVPAAPTIVQPSAAAQQQGQAAIPTAIVGSDADKIAIEISVSDVLDEKQRYSNSKKAIWIADEYRTFIETLAKMSDMDMTQIINNMLRPYFASADFRKNLKTSVVQKEAQKQAERLQALGV